MTTRTTPEADHGARAAPSSPLKGGGVSGHCGGTLQNLVTLTSLASPVYIHEEEANKWSKFNAERSFLFLENGQA